MTNDEFVTIAMQFIPNLFIATVIGQLFLFQQNCGWSNLAFITHDYFSLLSICNSFQDMKHDTIIETKEKIWKKKLSIKPSRHKACEYCMPVHVIYGMSKNKSLIDNC